MARYNKLILVGRLTRDPEVRTFANGGKVVKFGFAVSDRKKNQDGSWAESPMYIDCEAFNQGDNSKLADTVEKYCKKGSQILVEGELKLENWQDKASGDNRQKHLVKVFAMQLLDAKGTDTVSEDGSESEAETKVARKGRKPKGGEVPPKEERDAFKPAEEDEGTSIPF